MIKRQSLKMIVCLILFIFIISGIKADECYDAGLYIIHPRKDNAVIEKWTPAYQQPKTSESILNENYFVRRLKSVSTSLPGRSINSSRDEAKPKRVTAAPKTLTAEGFQLTEFYFGWHFKSAPDSEKRAAKFDMPYPWYFCYPSISGYLTNQADKPVNVNFRAVFIENTSNEELSAVTEFYSNVEPGLKKSIWLMSKRGYQATYYPKTKKLEYSILTQKRVTVRLYAKFDRATERFLGEFSIGPPPKDLSPK